MREITIAITFTSPNANTPKHCLQERNHRGEKSPPYLRRDHSRRRRFYEDYHRHYNHRKTITIIIVITGKECLSLPSPLNNHLHCYYHRHHLFPLTPALNRPHYLSDINHRLLPT